MQTSVVDGYQTLDDIEKKYGEGVAHIIRGLLRINELYKRNPVIERELPQPAHLVLRKTCV